MLDIRDLHTLQVELMVQLTAIRRSIEEVKAEAKAHRRETYHQLRALQEQQQKPSTGWKNVLSFEIWLRVGILITLLLSGLGLADSMKLIAF